ncbi:magnesium transporter [Coralloluteibacterium stylophorae]|uniref:Magnesium transporter MgtE n=1 Tax=Coralloluteibacterium stylophorae TaxID=1776034 RepID=A0A8J7VY07_9GAMM|nr:magnesium transporter [Coralloluteibacterium stylophorae]MBS7456749.1 magnesium transporter [Coralloluteibacterium stylophorae]
MAETTRQTRTAHQLRMLSDALDSGRLGPVRRLVNTLSPAEIGNLLESLPPTRRNVVWGLVDTEDDGEVLLHVGDDVRESLIAEMDPEEIVAALEDLDIDDLVELMDDLPEAVTEEVLRSMDRENRERLEQALAYPEDTAGRLMNPDVVTVRADATVDVVLRYLRLRGELPEHTDRLYVANRRRQYLGQVALSALLTREPSTPVNTLLDEDQPAIAVHTSANDVANAFSDHDWISAPVVDGNNVLLGRITIDDVVDIIREQAEHRALGAAGLDEDEDLFASPLRAMRRRALWLGINLTLAFVVASIIGLFESTLEQVVALAVLMPIVASMGGNAGLQAMTLTVRGLALGQLGGGNVRTLLVKEITVGLLNGVLWALVVAVVAGLWFHSSMLALAIASAMVINLACAAAAGVSIPVVMRRLNIDPAIAGSIVVTLVTDALGFFAFLGLGTVLLLK